MFSFHTHICIPLEHLANDYFAQEKIPIKVSADFIETGGFITIMECLLQHKFGNAPEVLEFLQQNSVMLGLTKNQMDDVQPLAAYEQFYKLFVGENLGDTE